MLRNLSLYFAAGCLGGLVNSLAVWLFGMAGITALMGVQIAPALTHEWLYPRVVWGGIWGFLFTLPYQSNSWQMRGFLFSLAPTAAQLFVVFPYQAGKGFGGVDLGTLTPFFVLFFNLIWGLTASAWIKVCSERRRGLSFLQ